MKDSCQPALDVFTGKGFALSCFASLDAACEALRTAGTKPELILVDESENRGEPEAMRKAVMALLGKWMFIMTPWKDWACSLPCPARPRPQTASAF